MDEDYKYWTSPKKIITCTTAHEHNLNNFQNQMSNFRKEEHQLILLLKFYLFKSYACSIYLPEKFKQLVSKKKQTN